MDVLDRASEVPKLVSDGLTPASWGKIISRDNDASLRWQIQAQGAAWPSLQIMHDMA